MGDRDDDYSGRILYESPPVPRNQVPREDVPVYKNAAQHENDAPRENGREEQREVEYPEYSSPAHSQPPSRPASLPNSRQNSHQNLQLNLPQNFHQSHQESFPDFHSDTHSHQSFPSHHSSHSYPHSPRDIYPATPSHSRPNSSSRRPNSGPNSGPNSQQRWIDARHQDDQDYPYSPHSPRSPRSLPSPHSIHSMPVSHQYKTHPKSHEHNNNNNYEYEPNSHADILQINDLEEPIPSPSPSPSRPLPLSSTHHEPPSSSFPLSSSQRFAATNYPHTNSHVPINENYDFENIDSYKQPNFPASPPKKEKETKARNYFVPTPAYHPPPPEYIIHPATPTSPHKERERERERREKSKSQDLSSILEPSAAHSRAFYVSPQNKLYSSAPFPSSSPSHPHSPSPALSQSPPPSRSNPQVRAIPPTHVSPPPRRKLSNTSFSSTPMSQFVAPVYPTQRRNSDVSKVQTTKHSRANSTGNGNPKISLSAFPISTSTLDHRRSIYYP